jgi:hypothetical protein
MIMAALAGSLLIAVPELVNHTRGKSVLVRSTSVAADILGAMNTQLGTAEFEAAVSLAGWAISPLPAANLAFRAQSFVRNGNVVTQEWERISGQACTPATAQLADAESLLPVEQKSLIVVSSCYTLPSLTGFSPELTLSSRMWQVARVGRVTVPNGGAGS